MNLKPTSFYISTIDLMAILLPGVIATLMIQYMAPIDFVSALGISADRAVLYEAVLFLFSSYLLGRVISQFSALLDWIHAPLARRIYRDQRRLELTRSIRRTYHSLKEGERYLNNFEWARARLLKELPEAVGEIERYQANSKFFRGLILIFLALAVLLFWESQTAWGVAALLMAAFSVVRYFHKRRKATEAAYGYVIFLDNRYPGDINGECEPQPHAFDPPVYEPPARFDEIIRFLTAGFGTQGQYWEVAGNARWKSAAPLPRRHTLVCLAGTGWVKLRHGSPHEAARIWLSPNGSISVPSQRELELDNPARDPFSLVSVSLD